MKQISIALVIAAFAFFTSSCCQTNGTDGNDSTKKETLMKEEVPETTETENVKKETITGTFRSIKGVMNNLSCYCYNGGFVTTAEGTEISICLPNENAEIDCKTVELTGHYETITIEPDGNSPCPAGELEVFMVSSFECK